MPKKKAAKKKVAKKKAVKKEAVRGITASRMITESVVETVTGKPKKKKTIKKSTGTCFVLMPFEEPFNAYYKTIIKPAVSAANLEPMRGDSLFTSTPIMGDVWQMIQDAKVLVAELTEKNPNVFYELGLGHAIGKPIVLISETMEDVPFDLRPLRVILYDKDDPAWGNKLKTSLTTALGDTLANAINAVPPMFRKKVKSQAPAQSEISLRLSALERLVNSLRSEELRERKYPGKYKPHALRGFEKIRAEIESGKGIRRDEVLKAIRTDFEDGIPFGVIREMLSQYFPEELLSELIQVARRER